MIEARRKLAKAMGWTHGLGEYCMPTLGNEERRKIVTPGWTSPALRFFADYERQEDRFLPDPFTDANDCEALILWLADYEFLKPRVTVSFGRGVRFDFYHGTHDEIVTDDWKQGVCDLALKVLEIELEEA